MEDDEISDCLICLEYPKEVRLTSCCKKAFCLKCISAILQKHNKCCHCRAQNIELLKDPVLQQKIRETYVPCNNFNCKQPLKNKDYDQHIKTQCQYLRLNCYYCRKILLKKQYLQHILKQHRNKFEEFVSIKLPLYQKSLLSNKSPKKVYLFDYDPYKQFLNRSGNVCKRGTTGLFYCGKSLKSGKCTCNGYCGPNNGCCCVDCMILLLKQQNISEKNILFNISGHPCKVEKNIAYCGKLIIQQEKYCDGKTSCGSCIELTKGIARYQQLLIKQ